MGRKESEEHHQRNILWVTRGGERGRMGVYMYNRIFPGKGRLSQFGLLTFLPYKNRHTQNENTPWTAYARRKNSPSPCLVQSLGRQAPGESGSRPQSGQS